MNDFKWQIIQRNSKQLCGLTLAEYNPKDCHHPNS